MTVQHAALAGAELHEPKGIESAANGQLYVANGSSTGVWRALTYGDFRAGPHAIIEDQKTTGTNGQNLTPANTDIQLNLNTITYNYGTLVTLAANQFVLPAGTYYFNFTSGANNTNLFKMFLYNVTDAAVAIVAIGGDDSTTGVYINRLKADGRGVITITTSKTFELRSRVNNNGGTTGGAYNDGRIEVYSRVEITKLV